MTDLRPAPELKPLFDRIIHEEFPDLEGEYIEILWMVPAPMTSGKIVLGRTSIVSGKAAKIYFSKFDGMDEDTLAELNQVFVIEISETPWLDMNENQKRRLVRHELMHCGLTESKDGNVKYTIIHHDVEDFRALIETDGFDFFEPKESDDVATSSEGTAVYDNNKYDYEEDPF